MFNRTSSTMARYFFALVAVVLATLLRFALVPALGAGVPFLLYFPTVALCAWLGGLGPGLFATALGAIAAWYFFIPPYFSLTITGPSVVVQIGLFTLVSAFISALTEALHKAERRAREQREQLQVTLASIGDAVIVTDMEGRLTFMNGVAESLTGWKLREATGRPSTEVFHIVNEYTLQVAESPVTEVIRAGKTVGLANHTVLVARDGTERPIDDSGAPIKDEAGRTLGAVLVFRDVSERRRSELAQAQLAAIVASSEDAIIGKDLAGIITSWNTGAETVFGYAAAEVKGRPITILIPPEQQDEETNILARIRLGERVEHYETVRVRKDGRRIPVSLSVSPIKNQAGEVIGASKIARDISARKQAEDRLAKAFKASPSALAISRLSDGMIFEVNDSWCALFGYAREEALGRTSSELNLLADAESRPRVVAALQERESVRGAEITVRTKAGEERLIQLFIEQIESNGELCMLSISRDVTDQRQMEQALRESEAKFATAFDKSPLALTITALDDGRLLEVNEGFLLLTGYTRAEALGRTPDELGLWIEPAERAERFARLRAGEPVPDIEARFRTKGGETLSGVIATTRVEINSRPCVLSSVTNITELSRTTEALRASEERLRLVHQATGIGLWEWNCVTNEVYWSDEYREIYGHGAGAPSFENGLAPVVAEDREMVIQNLSQAVAQNREFRTEHRIYHPRRGLRWIQSLGRAVHQDGGKPVRVAGLVMDITEKKLFEQEREQLLAREQAARAQAEAAEQQAAFLAQASELLASSLDYETTLKQVAHLAVPQIGDWCAVDIVSQDFAISQVAVEHQDPAKIALAEEFRRRYPPSPEDPGGLPQVLRTGQPVLYPEITDEMLSQGVTDAEQLALLRAVGLKSVMIVPLVARGRTLGAITFVTGESERCYTEQDLNFAQDLAHRAALAVDNARLYREAESALRAREQALELHQDLDQRLSALVEASNTLLGSMELAEVQQAILELSGRLIAADAYAVWRKESRGEVWRVVAATGLSQAFQEAVLQAQDYKAPQLERALAVEAVKEAAWLAHRHEAYRREGIESLLAIPLMLQGDFGATITFYYRRPHQFDEMEVRVATALANLAAAAISTTELYQEQSRLRSKAEEASRLKDEFLATVSHELRTPLNSMFGWIRMLRTSQLDATTSAKALETIEQSARAQNALIEDILDVSRIITGRLRLESQTIDVLPLLEAALDSVRPTAEAKGVWLVSFLDPAAGSISGDPQRLQQIVWNLLSNAIKFTPKDGHIELRLTCYSSYLEISVSDTGMGIRPEFLPFVFDRFRQEDSSSTRSHGGLGLGLAIVRHLVELHGGKVTAESQGDGRGATFTVTLPRTALRQELSPLKSLSEVSETSVFSGLSFDLQGVRILVVDDEAAARDLLTTALTQSGAEVQAATSAVEALALLDEWPPNVLVSDIAMPLEDGYTLIRQVRERGAERSGQIPAIALTAYAKAEDRLRALSAGFQMHVAKPVDPTELLAVIASQVGRLVKNRD